MTRIAVIKLHIYVGLGSELPRPNVDIVWFTMPWHTGEKCSVIGRESAPKSHKPQSEFDLSH